MNDYIRELPFGQYIMPVTHFLTLLVWIYISYTFVINKNMQNKYSYINLILLIPVFIICYNSYNLLVDDGFPSQWPFCLKKDLNINQTQEHVIGIYDLHCDRQKNIYTDSIKNKIINSFYYINYILFMIVLLVHNNIQKKVESTEILQIISLAVLLGVLGTTLYNFSDYPSATILFYNIQSALLTMNITLLIIVLVVFGTKIYKL